MPIRPRVDTQTLVEREMYGKRIADVTPANRKEWYNPPELAEYYGVTDTTIYKWIHQGILPFLKKGGRYYVHCTVVDWMEAQGRRIIIGQRRLYPRLVYAAVQSGQVLPFLEVYPDE